MQKLLINFYIFSKVLRLKRKELAGVIVVSLSKKEYGFAVHFLKIHKVFIKIHKSRSVK